MSNGDMCSGALGTAGARDGREQGERRHTHLLRHKDLQEQCCAGVGHAVPVIAHRVREVVPRQRSAIAGEGLPGGRAAGTRWAACSQVGGAIARTIVVTASFVGPLLLSLVQTRRPADLLWALAASIGITRRSPGEPARPGR